jgi:hypothetical protein
MNRHQLRAGRGGPVVMALIVHAFWLEPRIPQR